MQRTRGLISLITDAVDHGSRAVERVQMRMAKPTFDVLEAIPPIAVPAKGVHQIHDAAVAGVHGMIRLVNRVVGDTAGVVMDEIEKRHSHAGPEAPTGVGAPTPQQPEAGPAGRPSVD